VGQLAPTSGCGQWCVLSSMGSVPPLSVCGDDQAFLLHQALQDFFGDMQMVPHKCCKHSPVGSPLRSECALPHRDPWPGARDCTKRVSTSRRGLKPRPVTPAIKKSGLPLLETLVCRSKSKDRCWLDFRRTDRRNHRHIVGRPAEKIYDWYRAGSSPS